MAETWREVQGSEEAALQFLFPTKDKFKQLQMLSEERPKEVTPLSIVGLHRRLSNSKVLKIWQEEIFLNRKSLDRKGVLEAAEILTAARRRNLEDENERGGGL